MLCVSCALVISLWCSALPFPVYCEFSCRFVLIQVLLCVNFTFLFILSFPFIFFIFFFAYLDMRMWIQRSLRWFGIISIQSLPWTPALHRKLHTILFLVIFIFSFALICVRVIFCLFLLWQNALSHTMMKIYVLWQFLSVYSNYQYIFLQSLPSADLPADGPDHPHHRAERGQSRGPTALPRPRVDHLSE